MTVVIHQRNGAHAYIHDLSLKDVRRKLENARSKGSKHAVFDSRRIPLDAIVRITEPTA